MSVKCWKKICHVCGEPAKKREVVYMYYSKCEKHLEQHRRHNRVWKKRHLIKGQMVFYRPQKGMENEKK